MRQHRLELLPARSSMARSVSEGWEPDPERASFLRREQPRHLHRLPWHSAGWESRWMDSTAQMPLASSKRILALIDGDFHGYRHG